MSDVSSSNFGPLIAYLVPGAIALIGLSEFSATLQSWFAAASDNAPSIGGFLYLTVASIATGMTVSAIRWAIVDTFHGLTGLKLPELDFSRLGENVSAFTLLIDIHYRHYQFYANTAVATAMAYACYRIKLGAAAPLGAIDAGVAVLEMIFIATSRDTLRKYYSRTELLLSGRRRKSALR